MLLRLALVGIPIGTADLTDEADLDRIACSNGHERDHVTVASFGFGGTVQVSTNWIDQWGSM